MINIQAIALNLLLSCEDKQTALDTYEQISADFFTGMYHDMFRAVVKYYAENGSVPSTKCLAVKFSRNQKLQLAIAAIEQVDASGIDLDLAVDALRDEYAQQETLKLLQTKLLENISMLTSSEIVEVMASIPLEIEQKVQHTGTVLTQKDIPVFQKQEDLDQTYIATGLSNRFDSELGGLARQEVILIGGRRGGGKSVVCANMVAKQYRLGKIAPYYTIEMTGRETLLRILCVLAGVDALKVKTGTLAGEELYKLALTRAEMFLGGVDLYHKFIESRESETLGFCDFHSLDKELMQLPMMHPLIIIDDAELKLSSIDVSLSKIRAQYGDLLTMAVVDYLNEVKIEGRSDPYDWVYQKEVATGLKSLARKHDCGIAAPFQVADNGEARFSKAILDPVDMAFVLTGNKENGSIIFQSSKLRSLPDTVFKIGVNWRTLRTDPRDLDVEEGEVKELGAHPDKKEKPKRVTKQDIAEEVRNNPNPSNEELGVTQFEIY